MSNAINIVKIIGSWGCIFAALTFLILTPGASLVLPLSALSMAFSLAPTA